MCVDTHHTRIHTHSDTHQHTYTHAHTHQHTPSKCACVTVWWLASLCCVRVRGLHPACRALWTHAHTCPHTACAHRYDFEPDTFPTEGNIVLMLACYGMGEPTDSAREFYDWIMHPSRDIEAASGQLDFSKLRFAVFGLGSSKTHGQYCTLSHCVVSRGVWWL